MPETPPTVHARSRGGYEHRDVNVRLVLMRRRGPLRLRRALCTRCSGDPSGDAPRGRGRGRLAAGPDARRAGREPAHRGPGRSPGSRPSNSSRPSRRRTGRAGRCRGRARPSSTRRSCGRTASRASRPTAGWTARKGSYVCPSSRPWRPSWNCPEPGPPPARGPGHERRPSSSSRPRRPPSAGGTPARRCRGPGRRPRLPRSASSPGSARRCRSTCPSRMRHGSTSRSASASPASRPCWCSPTTAARCSAPRFSTACCAALQAIPDDVGSTFNVVVVSFDPREKPPLAALKKASYTERVRPAGVGAWLALPDRRIAGHRGPGEMRSGSATSTTPTPSSTPTAAAWWSWPPTGRSRGTCRGSGSSPAICAWPSPRRPRGRSARRPTRCCCSATATIARRGSTRPRCSGSSGLPARRAPSPCSPGWSAFSPGAGGGGERRRPAPGAAGGTAHADPGAALGVPLFPEQASDHARRVDYLFFYLSGSPAPSPCWCAC